MRKNSSEYRIWIENRNKKNLKLRTKKKIAKKNAKSRQINKNIKPGFIPKKNEEIETVPCKAPSHLSIINNPEETLEYFNCVKVFAGEKLDKKRCIFIDLSEVEIITIDAVMYLIAIMQNRDKEIRKNNLMSGNWPSNKKARELLDSSGFGNYIRQNGTKFTNKTYDNIQIKNNNIIDNKVAAEICDFSREKGFADKRLYTIIQELMYNTCDHAYEKNKKYLQKGWTIFAESTRNRLKYCFLDTGEGIANTVYKKVEEKLFNKKSDLEYIISALNGEGRTQTKEKNRGLGLPAIRKTSEEGIIRKFTVIANKGAVTYDEDKIIDQRGLENEFVGTLLYWEVYLKEDNDGKYRQAN